MEPYEKDKSRKERPERVEQEKQTFEETNLWIDLYSRGMVIPNRINTNRTISRYIPVKLLKTKDNILKSV